MKYNSSLYEFSKNSVRYNGKVLSKHDISSHISYWHGEYCVCLCLPFKPLLPSDLYWRIIVKRVLICWLRYYIDNVLIFKVPFV